MDELSDTDLDIKKSIKIIIIAALVCCFTSLVKILFDYNYYWFVKSQWQIKLGISCGFACGSCVGKCFCYFIVKKCQTSIAKKVGIIHSQSEKTHCRYAGGYVPPQFSQELKCFTQDGLMT